MDLGICHPYVDRKGGGERIVLKIAERFNAPVYTCEVDLDATYDGFRDVEIRKIDTFSPRFLGYRWTFRNIELEEHDLLNAQGVPSQWITTKNNPVIWYCHFPPYIKNRYIPGFMKKIEKSKIDPIEKVFVNSRYIQEKLKEYYGKDSEVLNPAIPVDEFKNKGNEEYFYFHSRLIPMKRFEWAIKAIHKVREKHPEFKLIITGFKQDDNYFNKLRRELGSAGEVIPNVSEEKMYDLYSRCYGFVYTPKIEDFGIVPTEAMASEKPVIAVNEGGPKYIVDDGKTGFLINSPKELADRMNYLIENPEDAKRMGKEGRKKAEDKYSWDYFLDTFERGCKEVLGEY